MENKILVAIDIGNTNIKIGIYNDSALKHSFRLSSVNNRTSDEYGNSILMHFDRIGIKITNINNVIIASVNPTLDYTFERACEYYIQKKPIFVDFLLASKILNFDVDRPHEIGADRLCGCVGAYKKYGDNFILIDCGTATVINVVKDNATFVGGTIGIGIKTASDSLSSATAKLPKVQLQIPNVVLGKNTIQNMQSGLVYGFIGSVEYLISKIKSEQKMLNASVIATGGLSELIKSGSDIINIIDRTLTLDGLQILSTVI